MGDRRMSEILEINKNIPVHRYLSEDKNNGSEAINNLRILLSPCLQCSVDRSTNEVLEAIVQELLTEMTRSLHKAVALGMDAQQLGMIMAKCYT